jgi:hypothetical protein
VLAFSSGCIGWIPFCWYSCQAQLEARTQPAPAYFTSRQSVLRRSFERSYRCCLVAAPSERIATVHLLRSPANAAHLQRSLEQSERGE